MYGSAPMWGKAGACNLFDPTPEAMEFVNLTPHKADVLDADGGLICAVRPSGRVGFVTGEPPRPTNVPPPQEDTAYIVLPAVEEASDRPDLLSIQLDEANRSHRGNVQSHVCYWSGT